jgi:hypothetical protein
VDALECPANHATKDGINAEVREATWQALPACVRKRFGDVSVPHNLPTGLPQDLLFGSIAAAQGSEELVEAMEDRTG